MSLEDDNLLKALIAPRCVLDECPDYDLRRQSQ